MSSQRQIDANRRNAQKSTGPTSVTGKAVSSMNALKTGHHAESLVLPTENLAAFQELIEVSYQRHQPVSPEACSFLDDFIYCEWSLRRLRAAEIQMVLFQNTDKFRDPEKYPLGRSLTSYSASFSKLQYRIDATRRALALALLSLQNLEAQAAATPARLSDPLGPPTLTPPPQTTSLQIGFVPATPISAPPEPSPAPGIPGPRGPQADREDPLSPPHSDGSLRFHVPPPAGECG
ncbi:MAG: hypothetical protein NTW28_14185 [Candidatus Solibacter sp.]|nr:hypothetical protein [Candidatus Solibacter sp.]